MTEGQIVASHPSADESTNSRYDWQGPVIVLAIVGAVVFFVNFQFFRVELQEVCDRKEDSVAHCAAQQFKYGTLGGEVAVGIPFRIFEVLPEVFERAEDGEGYEVFGFRYETECDVDRCTEDQCSKENACRERRDLPIGFSKSLMGYDRVTVNCALCHVTSYRLIGETEPRLVIGGPAHTVDLQAFLRFLNDVADATDHDERILEAILKRDEPGQALNWLDRLIYSWFLIPQAREKLGDQAERFAWIHDGRPSDWGPGRSDAINRIKADVIGSGDDGSTGQADFPDIWNLGQRRDRALFWGGEMRSIEGALIDHALAIGAPPGPETVERLKDIRDVMSVRQAPRIPTDYPIDYADAEEGKTVFRDNCARCHGWRGGHLGDIVPIQEIGTDSARFNAWSEQNADAMNSAVIGLGVEREPMIKTNGYAVPSLHGLWLRAPYLHNGSVPTLRDLLKPPKERPESFIRGRDLLNTKDVGFDSPACDPKVASERDFCFDTDQRGNGKGGHDYGTRLPTRDKQRLIEYLKTL